MTYASLFWAFFQIGLFSIGGGYAALPLIEHQVVELHTWLTMPEFADVVTLSQMTPGPIAINAASFVGVRIGGVWGALVATMGCVLPSSAIALLFAVLYRKYHTLQSVQGVLESLQPIVVGLIASAGVSILKQALWLGGAAGFTLSAVDWLAVAILLVCLLILRKTKVNPIFVMLGAGVVGGVLYSLQ